MNHTVDAFRAILDKLAADGSAPIMLANIDLDTGDHVRLGDYPLADETYVRLLERITSKPDRIIPDELKQNILEYYRNGGVIAAPEKRVSESWSVLSRMKSTEQLR